MNPASDPLHSIGDISRRSGVPASALRYYESRGLIQSVRTSSGRRQYRRSALRRIAFIVFAQHVGFSLDEISSQLERLPADHIPTCQDWQRLTGAWKAHVEQRIAELEKLKMGLTECIGCGCLSLKRCQVLNPDDRRGRDGPGPRCWVS